ncbi:MAG: hypothetical protein O3A63_20425 [Proteobacteria bacterium]|nr:hypothetical protein [Pseudomonadota bacterium]
MESLSSNPDLAWDLESFSEAKRAIEFVKQFETTLCVYSATVQQLYTNYDMFFPEEWEGKMVLLPNPAAFHDTFNHVAPESVTATGLYIIPGGFVGKSGLFLANVQDKDGERSLGKRQVPFEAGMRAIMERRPKSDPFLPVLAKGDLRELEQSWPVLHLHRVNPNSVEHLSGFDKTSIASVIQEKLESLFHALS